MSNANTPFPSETPHKRGCVCSVRRAIGHVGMAHSSRTVERASPHVNVFEWLSSSAGRIRIFARSSSIPLRTKLLRQRG